MKNLERRGVVGVLGYRFPTKRELLFFDRFHIYDAPFARLQSTNRRCADAAYLIERGVVVEGPGLGEMARHQLETGHSPFDQAMLDLGREKEELRRNIRSPKKRRHLNTAFLTRNSALFLRRTQQCNAVPILDDLDPFSTKRPASGIATDADVIEIVVNSLPVPSDDVSLEHILDFATDSENRNKLLDLNHWMRRIVRSGEEVDDIENELRELLHDYECRMKLARMKYEYGTLRTILTVAAACIENLALLSFSKIVDAFFAVKERKIQLLEAELDAPGREVAFLREAREQFGEDA